MRATSEEIAIFVAVVESGSFSRAAEQLGQANSAVSRAVKKLESKLSVSLLNRTTRQLSLTEEGERYFRRMQVVLQEMAAAENELLETRTTPRGLLRVDAATPGDAPLSDAAGEAFSRALSRNDPRAGVVGNFHQPD
ncbi:D-malate degradation protein R [Raoultella terrigena]|uniref:D-malate degradation protein R n=1 Tax=Raoultella terrigena TaxID=577 RepID=A0A4U9D6T0_RAOTE|nr:D-malate degradation protein R [Raoultella terrigena]